MEDWENFLHQILEEDSEDSAPIKMFLLLWGFGGKQRRLVAATGGRGWWKRRCSGLGGIWRGGKSENLVYHAEERIYNLQILLRRLILLSGSPFFVLSANPSALSLSQRANSCSTQFPLGLEMRVARPLRIARHQRLLFSKSQLPNCGERS